MVNGCLCLELMILQKWIRPAGKKGLDEHQRAHRGVYERDMTPPCPTRIWFPRYTQTVPSNVGGANCVLDSVLEMTRGRNEQISSLSPETYQMSQKVWHIKTKLEQLSAVWNVWNVPGNGRVCYKWANTSHFLSNTERPEAFSRRVKEFVIAGVLPLLSLLWVTCLSQRGFLLSVLAVLFFYHAGRQHFLDFGSILEENNAEQRMKKWKKMWFYLTENICQCLTTSSLKSFRCVYMR